MGAPAASLHQVGQLNRASSGVLCTLHTCRPQGLAPTFMLLLVLMLPHSVLVNVMQIGAFAS